jgi:hypothetical protein
MRGGQSLTAVPPSVDVERGAYEQFLESLQWVETALAWRKKSRQINDKFLRLPVHIQAISMKRACGMQSECDLTIQSPLRAVGISHGLLRVDDLSSSQL